MRPERLDKVLAGQSTWSRREVRDWITGGLVTVNGAPVRDPGQKIIQETDRVAVKGREITLRRFPTRTNPLGGFEAVYTATGDPVPGLAAANAGEQLTGVGKEVYLRSAFVGQGGEIGRAHV